jgi:NYN domain
LSALVANGTKCSNVPNLPASASSEVLGSNARERNLYAISQRQRSEWTRDPRVEVAYRTLRYPHNWPAKAAQEKGIDVLIALTVVKLATLGTYDVVMLASHDTDLEPALELAISDGHSKLETVGWGAAGSCARPVDGYGIPRSPPPTCRTRDRRSYEPAQRRP